MSGVMIGVFGVLTMICGVLVLALRQPMRSALALVAMMINLAAIYACLGAHVVAVFQVLIYVGAVMVFMVYTIMLLDERDTSYQRPYNRLALPGLVAAVLCAAAFFTLAGSLGTSPQIDLSGELFAFSSFSKVFMQKYWFHFELATVLLLAGIIAAWVALKEGRDG
jgi:NADH-quinone oxidoreductase subunit J